MKTRIVMLIMAVALIELPAMAQQPEWQSTSALQGAGSSYSSQVTAVGASEVTDMGTTTTSTPNNGPRRAKKDGDFGPGGQTGGYQDPNFPIGDAWPLALFAALFAIVITIKKHKQTIMKKNIKTFLFIAALLMSNSVWADSHTMPAGTYYFDFSACTGDNAARTVEIFNGMIKNGDEYLSLVSTATCAVNTGITQNSSTPKQFTNGGNDFTYMCVSLSESRTTDDANFMQYQMPGGGWKTWKGYTTPSPVSGKTNVYLCKVSYSEGQCNYTWFTGALPSNICTGTPQLTLSAGANGALGDECTYGGGTSDVEPGTAIHLVAEPAEHYTFGGWVRADGSVASYLAEYDFTMPSTSLSLTATFYADNTDPSISGCSGCFRVAP